MVVRRCGEAAVVPPRPWAAVEAAEAVQRELDKAVAGSGE